MQNTPVQRAVRYTFLSVGILLFMLMMFRVTQNANDPLAVRGVPSFFGLNRSSQTHGVAYSVAPAAQAQLASTPATSDSINQTASTSNEPNTPQTVPAAMSGTLPVQASPRAYQAQAEAAARQQAPAEPQIHPTKH